jgi:hypothetical protein
MLLGVVSSFVASIVYAFLAILISERIRRARAKPFTGKYRMFESDGSKPTGGTVRIERKNWGENLLTSAPILTVFGEHGTGCAPGTEDWSGTIEVLGLSKTATGYYSHPNRAGVSLRFELSNDADEITEYGTPFDPQSRPFMKVLKRDQ